MSFSMVSILKRSPPWLAAALLARTFQKRCGRTVHLRFERGQPWISGQPWIIRYERHSHRIDLVVPHTGERQSKTELKLLLARFPVLFDLVAATSDRVGRVSIDIGDGDGVADADTVMQCSSLPGALLVPDFEFLSSKSYAAVRAAAVERPAWQNRAATIVWRGSTTGHGRFPNGPDDLTAAGVLPRIRLAAIARAVPDTDIGVSAVVQSVDPNGVSRMLAAAGVLKGARPSSAWLGDKFAVDIDGNTNAWSNLFTRLLYGCCVLKVASPLGYCQWYYDRLEPWVHFVPVAADLSDFAERVAWCRSNDDACARIAAAGRDLALSLTFEDEVRAAVASIEARLGAATTRPAIA